MKEKHKQLIKEAKTVHILGFGFLESNYKLLGIEEYRTGQGKTGIELGKFFYSSFGLSEGIKNIVAGRYFGRYMGMDNAKAHDVNIYDYMQHYY